MKSLVHWIVVFSFFIIVGITRSAAAGGPTTRPVGDDPSLDHYKLKWSDEFDGKHYTGGGIISKQTFKYWYFEARFKVPAGAGWHNSFWTMLHDGSVDFHIWGCEFTPVRTQFFFDGKLTHETPSAFFKANSTSG